MANKVLIQEQDGTPKQIVFCDTGGDFSPTAANDLRIGSGNRTNVQFAMASVANGNARQSTKVDLGENRAEQYWVRAALEFAATPTAGNVVELYWAPSSSATAGTANAANTTGADGSYAGYSSNLDASLKQLQYIGGFVCTAQATGTIQVGEIGAFSPPERYGSLVVKNGSGAAMHTDDVEIHVVLDPIIPEVQ